LRRIRRGHSIRSESVKDESEPESESDEYHYIRPESESDFASSNPIRIRKNPIQSELQYKLHMMLVGFGFMGSYHGKCSRVELSQKGYVEVRGLTKCVKYITDDRK